MKETLRATLALCLFRVPVYLGCMIPILMYLNNNHSNKSKSQMHLDNLTLDVCPVYNIQQHIGYAF